ncbi:hypothetical protein PPYR_14674 [Photinus pyralis]|uniref:Glycosyltransferase-like protein LARGE2 n=1 Tax=Photinus pyralis TaxID=7054 RepID=A0A5N4A5W5_PHOPY|nr:LARGE xylosyl- and glucuronyltransferase 2-like [Photinus pyralis]KAB0792715.1 hypothetical protein PPYR_14674 [Photinus pyralis]
MSIKRVLQFVLSLVTLTIIIQLVLFTNLPRGTRYRNRDNFFCDAIHIGVLHVTSATQLYKTLKFLVFYRNSPLHFHFFVNETGAKIVNTLFETWHLPQVQISTYESKDSKSTDTLDEKLQSLRRPELLNHTDRLIVMGSNLLVMGDLQQFWDLFDHFQMSQVLGAVKRGDNKAETDIFLLDLSKLLSMTGPLNSATGVHFAAVNPQYLRWTYVENIVDKDELNSVRAILSNMGQDIPPRRISRCTDLHESNSTDAPTLPACSSLPESQMFKRRTLLFIRRFSYAPKEHDVTLVTQFPYEKLDVFEAMCRRWLGPISATVYLSEADLEKTIDFIEKSSDLKRRYNVAYHAVFKRGEFRPMNYLRNVALRNVVTSHVFLADIDYLPMSKLHKTLLPYLAKMATHKKALVIPAFATNGSKPVSPLTVDELKEAWDKRFIIPLPEKTLGSEHLPTDYKRLRNATEPYTIQWKPNHDPCIVVQSNVVEYDERFFGYGHGRVSHILELHTQNYEFIVLPNTFVVYLDHLKGRDYEQFAKDDYRSCLQAIIEQNVDDLNRKYGTKYNITNLYGEPTKSSVVNTT